MFAHVHIGASDLPRTCALNDRVLTRFDSPRTALLDAVGRAGIG